MYKEAARRPEYCPPLLYTCSGQLSPLTITHQLNPATNNWGLGVILMWRGGGDVCVWGGGVIPMSQVLSEKGKSWCKTNYADLYV